MDWNVLLRRFALLFLPLIAVSSAFAEPDGVQDAGIFIIQKYNNALQKQQTATRDISMEVTMEASIPKLKKQGKLNALRRISSVGHVTYKLLGFEGDAMVKREVIARYMNAEQEASEGASQHTMNIGITPDNYSFKYKGLNYRRSSRPVYVFELKPKQKRMGLFKGELWLDPETCLPVREQGQFVKNPSVFVKKMEFVRDYQIKNGVALIKHMEAKTDTRLIGMAELAIDYQPAEHTESAGEEAVEEARGRN